MAARSLFDYRGTLFRLDLSGIQRQAEAGPGVLDGRDACRERDTSHRIGLDRLIEALHLDGFFGNTRERILD